MSRPQNDQYDYLLKQWMSHPKFNNHYSSILNVIDHFCSTELRELSGDTQWIDSQVMMPKGFQSAYRILCDNAYVNLALKAPYGIQAPWVLHHIVWEKLAAGHISLTTCPMLSFGVLNTLIIYKNPQVEPYIPLLISGQCSATMCLTEAQCGTDLGLIQTKAVKVGECYKITGHKIWITYGDHDMSENILHLVLAKTSEDSSTKGLSLFLVPKLIKGKKNGVYCRGLVETMGQDQTPTCMMAFEEAKGYLLGTLNQGMQTIFTMMNPARIGVGVQALGLSEAAYQKALNFSKLRRSIQLNGKRIPIIKLPDVGRMLKNIEVTQYAIRLLVAYTSYHMDQENYDIVALLTPIVKAYATEQSVKNISESMQVMGGLGYLKIGQCEKYYRDARVTMIYEGTNGVQAIDLLIRKILKDKGRALKKICILLEIKDKGLEEIHQKMTNIDQQKLLFIASAYLQYLALTIMQALMEKDEYIGQSFMLSYLDYALPEKELHKLRIMQSIGKKELV